MKEDGMSRRKFFRYGTKRLLPFLGIVEFGGVILSSCSKEEDPLGCNNSCTGTAQIGCGNTCTNSCVGTNQNGCGSECTNSCQKECNNNCSNLN